MSKHRKPLLLIAGLLGVVYLGWLSASIMKVLPDGLLSAWYTGFGIFGVAVTLAALGLKKPAGARPREASPAAISPAAALAPMGAPRTRAGNPMVFTPDPSTLIPTGGAPAPASTTGDFARRADSGQHLVPAAGPFDNHDTPPPAWTVHNTSEHPLINQAPNTPMVGTPMAGGQIPAMAPGQADPFAQWHQNAPMAHDQHAPVWGHHNADPDDIQIMASYADEFSSGAGGTSMEPSSMQSIDEAIRQYTFELYDMNADDDGDQGSRRSQLEAIQARLGTSAPQAAAPQTDALASLLSASAAPYIDDAEALGATRDHHGVVLAPFLTGLGVMSADDLNTLWQQYVHLSVECGREPMSLKYTRFYKQLIANYESISGRYNCENIRFRVKVKNGKPALSARPV